MISLIINKIIRNIVIYKIYTESTSYYIELSKMDFINMELAEVFCHTFTAASALALINRHVKYRSFIRSIKDPFPLPKSGEEFFVIGYPTTKDELPIYQKKYLEKGTKYEYTTTHFQKVGSVNVPIIMHHEGTNWEKISPTYKKWLHDNFKLYFKEFNGREKFDCELKKSECGKISVDIVGRLSWKSKVPVPVDFQDVGVEKQSIKNYDKLRIQESGIKGNGKYPIIVNCQYDRNTKKFQTNSIFLKSINSFARKRTPWMRSSMGAFCVGLVGSGLFILDKFGTR